MSFKKEIHSFHQQLDPIDQSLLRSPSSKRSSVSSLILADDKSSIFTLPEDSSKKEKIKGVNVKIEETEDSESNNDKEGKRISFFNDPFEELSLKEFPKPNKVLLNRIKDEFDIAAEEIQYPLVLKEEILKNSKEKLLESYKIALDDLNHNIKKLIIIRTALKKKEMINCENEVDKEVMKRLEDECFLTEDENVKKLAEDCIDERTREDYINEGKELNIHEILCIRIYV